MWRYFSVGGKREVSPKGVAHPINIYDVLGIQGEYQVMLPIKKPLQWVPLTPPMHFQFVIVESKDVGHNTYDAELLAIDEELNALIRLTATELEKDMNIKMDIAINDERGDVYAKVGEKINEDIKINLTAIPPEIEFYLLKILEE